MCTWLVVDVSLVPVVVVCPIGAQCGHGSTNITLVNLLYSETRAVRRTKELFVI